MAAKKKVAEAGVDITPCIDANRRTCLLVEQADGQTKYIPLDVTEGLTVCSMETDEFDQRFTPMAGYPVTRAAKLYLSYAQSIGASEEALTQLGRVITISQQEFDMATKKRTVRATVKPAAGKKQAAKKTAAKKQATEKQATGERKPSAAKMFQELIMAGRLTDDKIFEKVQAEFGLDDSKKAYVKWYRNHLKKQGMNPPDAK